jgi:hypothetical protein
LETAEQDSTQYLSTLSEPTVSDGAPNGLGGSLDLVQLGLFNN